VEKTSWRHEYYLRIGKHLHGRGEDRRQGICKRGALETPPRAWRRLAKPDKTLIALGNTSTGVEKTHSRRTLVNVMGKHLHGRGEDLISPLLPLHFAETPPRAWRRLLTASNRAAMRGNTSTGVEKTQRDGKD